jgi:hypothetical protein
MTANEWAAMYSKMPKRHDENPRGKLLSLFPYAIPVSDLHKAGEHIRRQEIQEWLIEYCKPNEFVFLGNIFYFQDDMTAMQFKLTWR